MQTIDTPNYVETTAPIGIEVLKRQFTEDDVVFVLDYKESKIKGQVFLTYLSNLDIQCHVKIEDVESGLELLKAYLSSPTLINLPELEDLAMHVLLASKGLEHDLDFDPSSFIDENQEMVEHWLVRLESLSLFSVYCVEDDSYKAYVESHPLDETNSMVGCNFVNLIKNEAFPILIAEAKTERLRYFSKYFNDYIFKGNNLFTYWAVPENPLYIMTKSILSEDFNIDDFQKAKQMDLEIIESNSDDKVT